MTSVAIPNPAPRHIAAPSRVVPAVAAALVGGFALALLAVVVAQHTGALHTPAYGLPLHQPWRSTTSSTARGVVELSAVLGAATASFALPLLGAAVALLRRRPLRNWLLLAVVGAMVQFVLLYFLQLQEHCCTATSIL